MGTASTMALVAEALGMMLPGGATPPAVTADRVRIAEQTGATAVRLAHSRLAPRDILTADAFENALRVLMAIGGSTNGIIHLAAIAGRVGIAIDLAELDRMGRETPVLVDMKPSGRFYMEDLHNAGGLATLLRELAPMLNLDARTVTGRTLGEELAGAPAPFAQQVVRTRDNPLHPQGAIAVLRGNLAADHAIIKQSAADPALMEHEGRAVVFENVGDLVARIDRDDLDVEPDDILVLKNIGPIGAPGMPEAGYLPIPRKLARRGVKDMVRISDGRMSGTAAGTIVLHVSPEAAAGGVLALVQNGDRIRLSVRNRELSLLVADDELAQRARDQHTPPPAATRGYARLFVQSVTQAGQGVDFDFLRADAITVSVPRSR
jgi:dihydroxy-acid dehydratase